MASTDKIIEGMQILSNYYGNKGSYNTGAEHDIIYMFATELPVSEADVQRLYALGWNQESVDHDAGEKYDPEESWMIFV